MVLTGVIPDDGSHRLTPLLFRRLLVKNVALRDAANTIDIVRALLTFAISDLTAETYGQLQGLKLVPLANGNIGIWGRQRYVCATPQQQALTPLLSDIMIDAESVTTHTTHFQHPTFQHLYLIPFSSTWLADQMSRLYTSPHYTSYKHKFVKWNVSRSTYQSLQEHQSNMEGGAAPTFHDEKSESRLVTSAVATSSSSSSTPPPTAAFPTHTPLGLPSLQWIRAFWSHVSLHDASQRRLFASWPLIPLREIPSQQIQQAQPQPTYREYKEGDVKPVSRAAVEEQVTLELAAVSLFQHILAMPSPAAWAPSQDVASALLSISYPILDWSFFDTTAQTEHADTIDNLPLKVLHAIPELMTLGHIQFHTITPHHANTLVGFFAGGFAKGLYTVAERGTLVKLPIFQCFAPSESKSPETDRFTALSSSASWYMLGPDIDNVPDVLEAYLAKQNCFLKFKFSDFYRFVGVIELTRTSLIERFLPPAFLSMDDIQQDTLITWVQSVLSGEGGNVTSEMKRILGALPFVKTSRGNKSKIVNESKSQDEGPRVAVTSLYDPRHPLLSHLFRDDPVFPLNTDTTYLDFLVSIGLPNTLDLDVYLSCAIKLQSLVEHMSLTWNGDDMETCITTHTAHRQQMSLINGWNATQQTLHEKQETQEISRLVSLSHQLTDFLWSNFTVLSKPAFWARLSQLAFVATTTYQGHILFCSFKQCCQPADKHLAWTMMPVLSDAQAVPDVCMKYLGMTSPPPLSIVIAHVARVTTIPIDKWTYSADSAMISIFKYLDNKWNEMTAQQKAILQSMSLIPVSSHLIRPSRLYFRLEHDLSPFVFEIPRHYGQFDSLFEKLGTRHSPTRDDFLILLHEIKADLGSHSLNINELHAVMACIKLLVNQDIGVSKTKLGLLCVDEYGQLHPIQDLVINDSPALARRCDHTRLRFVNVAVNEELAHSLGVRGLSTAIREHVTSLGTIVNPTSQHHDVISILHSHKFAAAIVRLIEHHVAQDQSYTSWIQIPKEETIWQLLKSITIRFVTHIHTRLMYGRIDVTRESDDDRYQHALTSISTDGRTVHISTADTLLPLDMIMATVVTQLLRTHLPSTSSTLAALRNLAPIATLFRLQQATSTDAVLDRLEIHALDRDAITRGVPGERVIAADQAQLALEPLRRYYVGETCCIKDDAGIYRYATIVSDNQRDSYDALGRIVVQTSRGHDRKNEKTLLSSQIYCFVSGLRSNKSGENKNVDVMDLGLGPVSAAAHDDVKELDLLSSPTPSSTATTPSTSTVTSSAPTSTPPVDDRRQLISAVTSLLQAAQLPLSLDQQSLLHDNLALRSQLAEHDTKMAEEKHQQQILSEKVEKYQSAFTCAICSQNEVDSILVKCGHSICKECEGQLRSRHCPFCRAPYVYVVPFFKPW